MPPPTVVVSDPNEGRERISVPAGLQINDSRLKSTGVGEALRRGSIEICSTLDGWRDAAATLKAVCSARPFRTTRLVAPTYSLGVFTPPTPVTTILPTTLLSPGNDRHRDTSTPAPPEANRICL